MGDLDVLLTSTAEELGVPAELREETERWLAWLRCWYGKAVWPRVPDERLHAKDSAWR